MNTEVKKALATSNAEDFCHAINNADIFEETLYSDKESIYYKNQDNMRVDIGSLKEAKYYVIKKFVEGGWDVSEFTKDNSAKIDINQGFQLFLTRVKAAVESARTMEDLATVSNSSGIFSSGFYVRDGVLLHENLSSISFSDLAIAKNMVRNNCNKLLDSAQERLEVLLDIEENVPLPRTKSTTAVIDTISSLG